MLGTPEYMAPEQAMGRPADSKSDLYALGIIVYRMLLGKTPFLGKTPSETLMAHVHQALPLPRSLDPEVDPRVEASLVKVLAKDPSDRYQTPRELMQVLASSAALSSAAVDAQDTVEGKAVRPTEVGRQRGRASERVPVAVDKAVPGRISLDRSRVLAMSTARETPGDYGGSHSGVSMAYEVAAEEETEEHYIITRSFRPQGTFTGTPGQEQFSIDKQGSVAHRQVLKLPADVSGRRLPVVPIALGSTVVAVGVVIGLVAIFSGGGEDEGGKSSTAAPVAPPNVPPVSESAPATSVRPVPTVAPPAAAVLPAPAALTAAEVRGKGTALIWDDKAVNDSLTYSLTGVTPPGDGKVYVGWLATADRSLKVTTGPNDGAARRFHTPHRRPRLTGVPRCGPNRHIQHHRDNSRDHRRRIRRSAGAARVQRRGAAKGHGAHPAPVVRLAARIGQRYPDQLEVAIFHAGLAQESDTIEEVRQHTEHVINIIEGPDGANYGDLDRSGVTEDPGDGIGVLTHAIDRKHARFAASQAPDYPVLSSHAALVDSFGQSAQELATLARNLALEVLSAGDMASVNDLVGPGTGSVKSLLEAAMNGLEEVGQGGAAQAYLEAQRMATYTLEPVAVVTEEAEEPSSSGQITYGLEDGRIYRVEAREGAVTEEVSVGLDTLSPGGGDRAINISPDGTWLVVESERFDPDCIGWACLAIVTSELSTGEAVLAKLDDWEVVHPGQGMVAVASGGELLVYQQGGVVGSHVSDLFALKSRDGNWGSPLVLTESSPYMWHQNPAISDDGSTVLLQCSDQEWEGNAICEVGTDGSGFRVVLSPEDGPAGAPETATLHNPDYAPDGSIVFAADWDEVSTKSV